MMASRRSERYFCVVRKSSPLVFAMTILFASFSSPFFLGVRGFVNVPSVRKPALQSTSTSVTYEPAHLLTDTFQRDPFAEDEGDTTTSTITTNTIQYTIDSQQEFRTVEASGSNVASAERNSPFSSATGWVSQIADNFGRLLPQRSASRWWTSRYVQAELERRKLRKKLRIQLHHMLRDSGLLRGGVDFLVTIGTPALAMDKPEIIPRFLQLTQDCIRIPYGTHDLQGIDMFLPKDVQQPRGLLFFVHGGSWGSGLPWMYRLVAQPFLDQGMAVAVVGYRTFPDGDIDDQVNDLEQAAQELTKRYPNLCLPECQTDLGVCVMGHSSGAHIAMQMLVNRLLRLHVHHNTLDEDLKHTEQMRIDSLIGMSAPYDIASHYELETLRGLQELSPMKAACGNNKERLSEYSPVLQLFRTLVTRPRHEQQRVHQACPRIAMIHGVQDDTVPFSSSRQAAKLLGLAGIQKCQEMYLSETGHSDTVFELMFGGKTQDAVVDWLLAGRDAPQEQLLSASQMTPPTENIPTEKVSELSI